jgi:hypothetical protein
MISPYLDKQALKTRKDLRTNLAAARKAGKHAVIRNNKLIINGQEHIPQSENEPWTTTTHLGNTTAENQVETETHENRGDQSADGTDIDQEKSTSSGVNDDTFRE